MKIANGLLRRQDAPTRLNLSARESTIDIPPANGTYRKIITTGIDGGFLLQKSAGNPLDRPHFRLWCVMSDLQKTDRFHISALARRVSLSIRASRGRTVIAAYPNACGQTLNAACKIF